MILLLIGIASADTLIVNITATAQDGVFANVSTTNITTKLTGIFDYVNTTDDLFSPRLTAHTSSGNYTIFRRTGFSFDTSALPDDAVISAVNFSFILGNPTKANGLGSPTLGLTGFTPTTGGSLVAGDGDNNGTVRFATDVPYASVTTTAFSRMGMLLNSDGIAAVNKTGYTNLMLRFGDWDIDSDTSTLTWSGSATSNYNIKDYSYASNSSYAPRLEITYSSPTTSQLVFLTNGSEDGNSYVQVTTGDPYTYLRSISGVWYQDNQNDTWVRLRSNNSADADQYDIISRAELMFDTSALPDNATITSATLSVYAKTAGFRFTNLGVVKYGITGFTASYANGSIRTHDFENEWADRFSDTDLTPTAASRANNWTLNALGLSNISRTGYTNLMIRQAWDIDDNATGPTWVGYNNKTEFAFFMSEYSPSTLTYRPLLTVNYNTSYVEATPDQVTFTGTQASGVTCAPICDVGFTDTSTVNTPTSYAWEYKDYSNSSSAWNSFSTSEDVSSSWFGNGNFSIKHSVTNASTTYSSSAGILLDKR